MPHVASGGDPKKSIIGITVGVVVAFLAVGACGAWYFSHRGQRGAAAFSALNNDPTAVRFEDTLFEHPSAPGSKSSRRESNYEGDEIEMENA